MVPPQHRRPRHRTAGRRHGGQRALTALTGALLVLQLAAVGELHGTQTRDMARTFWKLPPELLASRRLVLSAFATRLPLASR